ncbi:MAG: glycerophosphodiester phosphodiesterase [Bacteroidales bacterium]|nr:glycerophosphodiester phosphodiesterase [Bacteroidales bacterium]
MKKLAIFAAALLSAASLLAQEQEVRVFAHRAGRNEFEENVLPSFRECNAKGMNGFETDVRLTADGHFVISHDADMGRMYDRPGIIEELTLKELKTFHTKNGNQIMTLDELLDFLKDKKGLYVEFEMKTTDEKAYPMEKLTKYCDKLYKTIMKAKPADATFLMTSFDTRAVRYLSTTHPGEDFLMLINSDPITDKTIALAQALNVRRLAGTIHGTSRQKVKEAHDKGLIISLWPGTSPADFMLGVSLGADYLCTDVPCQIMEWTKKTPWINVKF